MRKSIAMMLAVLLLVSLTACGPTAQGEDGKYVIGICQIMVHDSLDDATRGFQDAVIAGLGEENVKFLEKDAGGDYANCASIMDGFVAENVDLILANSTFPLQAAVSATVDIPILGTSITDYMAALGVSDYAGAMGGNISGTTDLAPLDQLAAVIQELFPNAENVGMLYCSSEPNSIYQITTMKGYLTEMGYSCTEYAFTDVNDLSLITQAACDSSDVIYIPTDNNCATYKDHIANVVLPAGVPVVASEASTCAAAGVATMAISYYDLGYVTGQMAVKILNGEAEIGEMPIQTAGEAIKMYNPTNCEKLAVAVPEGYIPVPVE